MKNVNHIADLKQVCKILSHSDVSEENCKIIGEIVMNYILLERELRAEISLLNKMNAENYNKYCELLIKYNELKGEVEKDVR